MKVREILVESGGNDAVIEAWKQTKWWKGNPRRTIHYACVTAIHDSFPKRFKSEIMGSFYNGLDVFNDDEEEYSYIEEELDEIDLDEVYKNVVATGEMLKVVEAAFMNTEDAVRSVRMSVSQLLETMPDVKFPTIEVNSSVSKILKFRCGQSSKKAISDLVVFVASTKSGDKEYDYEKEDGTYTDGGKYFGGAACRAFLDMVFVESGASLFGWLITKWKPPKVKMESLFSRQSLPKMLANILEGDDWLVEVLDTKWKKSKFRLKCEFDDAVKTQFIKQMLKLLREEDDEGFRVKMYMNVLRRLGAEWEEFKPIEKSIKSSAR